MIRLLLDEDSAAAALVAALRRAGFDVLTVAEVGRLGLPDEEQLAFAANSLRTLVTANQGDFAAIHARWLATGLRHAGIIIRRQRQAGIGPEIRALQRIATRYAAAQLENGLEYLSNWMGE